MATAAKRLKKARKIRRRINTELHALKTGQLSLESVLRNPSDALGRVSVYQVLIHARRMGPAGAKRCLERSHVWPETRLRDLSDEERELVVKCLPPRGKEKYDQAE